MPGPFNHVSETNAQQIHSWLKPFCLLDLQFSKTRVGYL